MSELRFKACVKPGSDGKPLMVFYKPAAFRNELFHYLEKDVWINIEPVVLDKTINQLGFYRAGIIRDACMNSEYFVGWQEEEIADYLEDMFLTEPTSMEIHLSDGNTQFVMFNRRGRVSSLNIDQMNKFIESCIRYLAQEGIPVKDPEDYIVGKYRKVTIDVPGSDSK